MILNPALQLNIIDEYKQTRDGAGDGLVFLGEKNKDVVVLTADLRESTRAIAFAKAYPDRFFDCGVAEQNMAGVAAGLALSGKIPYMASFGVFSPGRNWDQIRVSICYSKANVKIISSHTGLSVGEDGASHQALEDIAIARVLPNMKVFAPVDYEETKKVIQAVSEFDGPAYIRFSRNSVKSYTTPQTPFAVGKAYVYVQGSDITLLSTGYMLESALKAAEALEKEGISAEVIHVPTIKPLDHETILSSLEKTKRAVTIEDHQIAGGFGSAVLEMIAAHGKCFSVKQIGMQDSFGESGSYQELYQKYHMTCDDILLAAKSLLV